MEKEPSELTPDEVIDQKLRDSETPGYEVAFDPDEADSLAFHEDALSDQDARESVKTFNAEEEEEERHGHKRLRTTAHLTS